MFDVISEQNMVYKAVKRGGPYYSCVEVWDKDKLTPPERENMEKFGFYETEEDARNALWGELYFNLLDR